MTLLVRLLRFAVQLPLFRLTVEDANLRLDHYRQIVHLMRRRCHLPIRFIGNVNANWGSLVEKLFSLLSDEKKNFRRIY